MKNRLCVILYYCFRPLPLPLPLLLLLFLLRLLLLLLFIYMLTFSDLIIQKDLASSIRCASIAVFLMSIFYLGPLVVQLLNIILIMYYKLPPESSLEPREGGSLSFIAAIKEVGRSTLDRYDFSYLKLFRDIVFAPITEELVFRALLINIMYRQSCTNSSSCTKELALHCRYGGTFA